MLTIRTSQLEQIDAQFQERLVRSVWAHVQDHLPDEYAYLRQHDAGGMTIRQSLALGRDYELTTDANLTIFTDFCLVFGPAFPQEYGWAVDVLTSDSLTEDQKTEQLQAHLDTYLNDEAKP